MTEAAAGTVRQQPPERTDQMKPTHDQAAIRLRNAIQAADRRILRLREQEHTMRPTIYAKRLREARNEGDQAIKAARQELGDAIQRERRESLRELRPTAEDAARRTYYATRGMALAQAGMTDLLAQVKAELAAGNQVAAGEYLTAGGSNLQQHMHTQGKGGEYRQLQRAATLRTAGEHAALRDGLDAYEGSLGRLDAYLRQLPARLGMSGDLDDPDAAAKRHDVSEFVNRWHHTAESEAAEAGTKTAQAHTDAMAACGVTEGE